MTSGRRRLSIALAVLIAGVACQVPGQTKSADAIYRDARSAVGSTVSYRLTVTLNLSGSRQSYSLAVAKSGGSSGTVTIDGTPVDIIQSGGSTYMRGNAFVAKYGNPDVAVQLGNRWVRTNTNPLGSLAILGPDALAQTIKGKSSLQNGGDQTLDGSPVTKLYDKDGAIYVARDGKPYIVRVESSQAVLPGGLKNLIADFSEYDRAKPDLPPASFIDATR